ncbi:nuclear transport factor 2 family protein [Alphaproteobacteria bacterium]|nr:nuclear transport factor 2 family protein [Alphaproteobacteria bacterium]
MSILEKYEKVFLEKDEAGMNEILHDDFKFTMHSTGNVLSKSDVISWAMSDDIHEEKVRILYENDEIGVRHNFVTFKDGNTQAIMAVYMFKDGQISSMETGATNMPK